MNVITKINKKWNIAYIKSVVYNINIDKQYTEEEKKEKGREVHFAAASVFQEKLYHQNTKIDKSSKVISTVLLILL